MTVQNKGAVACLFLIVPIIGWAFAAFVIKSVAAIFICGVLVTLIGWGAAICFISPSNPREAQCEDPAPDPICEVPPKYESPPEYKNAILDGAQTEEDIRQHVAVFLHGEEA